MLGGCFIRNFTIETKLLHTVSRAWRHHNVPVRPRPVCALHTLLTAHVWHASYLEIKQYNNRARGFSERSNHQLCSCTRSMKVTFFWPRYGGDYPNYHSGCSSRHCTRSSTNSDHLRTWRSIFFFLILVCEAIRTAATPGLWRSISLRSVSTITQTSFLQISSWFSPVLFEQNNMAVAFG
jgi:hypothetical protein